VRRMTAAIGYPTLRLIRWRIGEWTLDDLAPGQWRELQVATPALRAAIGHATVVLPRQRRVWR